MSSDSSASLYWGLDLCRAEFQKEYLPIGLEADEIDYLEIVDDVGLGQCIHYDGSDEYIVGVELYKVDWGSVSLSAEALKHKIEEAKEKMHKVLDNPEDCQLHLCSEYF